MTITVDPAEAITPRQLELIALYASGVELRDIAERKFMSYRSVQNRLTIARDRVGARSLTHLCVLCVEHGLIVRNGTGFKPIQAEGVVAE
jgi:DNA-binding NarL/FixJ family response regulator